MQHGSLAERFSGGETSGNGCVELAATSQTPELYFSNTLMFGNTGGGACYASFDFSNVGSSPAHVYLSNVHLENSQSNNAHYFIGNYILSMANGVAEDDNSTSMGDWMFSLSSTASTVLMHGTVFNSSRAYTNVFLMGGMGPRIGAGCQRQSRHSELLEILRWFAGIGLHGNDYAYQFQP